MKNETFGLNEVVHKKT